MTTPLFSELLTVLEAKLETLPDKPEEDARSTLEALWWTAAGRPASVDAARGHTLPALDERQRSHVRQLVDRRLSGAPLGHLTGRTRFLDVEMRVGKGALLPRRETEIVGRGALDVLEQLAAERPAGEILVADVCTGAGNLAVAFAKLAPRCRVVGADISPEAIAVARQNAEFVGVADRVELRVGDLAEPVRDLAGAIDLLTCNPPYISSTKVPEMAAEICHHEPSLAFDGGPFGVKVLTRLLGDAPGLVRPGGWLAFEVGLGQGPAMAKKLHKNPSFSAVRTLTDQVGQVRALVARVNAVPSEGAKVP